MNVDSQQLEQKKSPGRAAIRSDIEATRARMGDTLEELGARLNPDRLKQQAKDKVRDATIGRVQTMARTTADKAATAGRTVTDVVRDNPIPAALIAVGIGWLAFNSRRSGSSTSAARYEPQPIDEEFPRVQSRADLMNRPARATSFDEPGQPRAHGVTDTVRDKASAVVDATQDVAHRAAEGAANTASTVATTVSETARTQSARVAQTFRENPLAMGAAVTALGIAAGFLIPSTQKESELLGEKRDELVDKTREVVREKKEQVQHVAQRVVTEAKSVATRAAREEGLTS